MASPSARRAIVAPTWVGWLFWGFLAAFFSLSGLVLWSFARRTQGLMATRFCLLMAYSLFFSLVVTVIALRSAGRRGAGPARDPNRPWLWRSDWASGRCEESSTNPRLQIGLVALATPGIVGVPWVVLGALEEGGVYRPWMAVGYSVALIPLLVVLRGHVRRRIRERRFGRSVLTLPRVPIAPGETLPVTLATGRPLTGVSSATLTVSCLRRVTSGDSFREEVIWTESKTAPLRDGREAPMTFALPADLPGTDPLGLETEVLWRLAAKVPTQGLAYEATFLLPVFASAKDRDG